MIDSLIHELSLRSTISPCTQSQILRKPSDLKFVAAVLVTMSVQQLNQARIKTALAKQILT